MLPAWLPQGNWSTWLCCTLFYIYLHAGNYSILSPNCIYVACCIFISKFVFFFCKFAFVSLCCICVALWYLCCHVDFLTDFLTDFWTDSWADFLIEFGTDFWIDFQTNYQKSLLGNFAGNFFLTKLKIVCRAAICLALYKALSVWIWLDRWKKKIKQCIFMCTILQSY